MPVAAAFAGIWLFTLITAAAIVSRRSSPEINCAAVIMIIALPVAGAVIYLIATAKRKLRGEIKFTGARPENGIDSACFKACGICAMPYSRAEYFADGDEYFTQLFKEIEKAEKSVYLEYFIMCRGRIFSRLVSALAVANRNGAEIKIIIDGIGCAFKLGRKDLKKLKTAGAEIRIFHRLKPLPHSRLNLRDHRKIASIDGKVAFTGGINIADEYANTDSPYGYWKDVGAAVYGGAAIAFEAMFLSLWNGSYEAEAPQAEGKKCLPFCDLPPNRPSFAEDAFVYAVSSAKEKIHILTPYFCVSEKIHSALRLAAMRGVDVRIILPHIPDKKYALELSRACAERLMPAGVKFYEYTGLYARKGYDLRRRRIYRQLQLRPPLHEAELRVRTDDTRRSGNERRSRFLAMPAYVLADESNENFFPPKSSTIYIEDCRAAYVRHGYGGGAVTLDNSAAVMILL